MTGVAVIPKIHVQGDSCEGNTKEEDYMPELYYRERIHTWLRMLFSRLQKRKLRKQKEHPGEPVIIEVDDNEDGDDSPNNVGNVSDHLLSGVERKSLIYAY